MEPTQHPAGQEVPEALKQPLRIRQHTVAVGNVPHYRIFHTDGSEEVVEAATAYEAYKKITQPGEVTKIMRENTVAQTLVEGEALGAEEAFVELGFVELFSEMTAAEPAGTEQKNRPDIVVIPAPDTMHVDFLSADAMPQGMELTDTEGGGKAPVTANETSSAPEEAQEDDVMSTPPQEQEAMEATPQEAAAMEESVATQAAASSEDAEAELSADEVEALLNEKDG